MQWYFEAFQPCVPKAEEKFVGIDMKIVFAQDVSLQI